MPAKLAEGKSLKRLIKVYGIEGPVELTISHSLLSMRIPKTRKSVSADWPEVVRGLFTPDDAPAFLAGEPLKFLQHEAAKVVKRAVKKADKAKKAVPEFQVDGRFDRLVARRGNS